jgi:glucose-1-phosphatase
MKPLTMKSFDIKNIVFDFGGILLDINYKLTYEAMSRLLGIDMQDGVPMEVQRFMDEYEMGKITTETFLWKWQTLIENPPEGRSLIDAWNAMLIGWNPRKFDMLLELRKKYKVYLLSNTNELHLEWVRRDLKKNYSIDVFDEVYFDKTYYSHIVGLRKPSEEIYRHVQEDQGLIPEETIFIDDLAPNLVSPKALGWRVYHHNPSDDLIEVLEKKLQLI